MSFALTLDQPADTERAACALGRVATAGDAIGLRGDLGAGKTHFVQGLARGLDVPPAIRVTSPTFTLLNEYRGGRLTLFHADLYRLEKAIDLGEIGIDDALRAGGLVAIEWSDRFPALPADHLDVAIEVTGAESRVLSVRALGPASVALLERWRASLPGVPSN